MKDNLDHIRRIQTQLAETPCRLCRRQGLVLLLRYDGHKRRCLFIAFCKACQMKASVYPDSTSRLDVQELHELGTVPAIMARP
ncbi:MAG: hypothetical protein ABI618_11585 [Nitrospirota bacterium]